MNSSLSSLVLPFSMLPREHLRQCRRAKKPLISKPCSCRSDGQVCAVRYTSPINNASMPDFRNVTIASEGVHTIGSLSLKDVLMTSGTPVWEKKHDMSS